MWLERIQTWLQTVPPEVLRGWVARLLRVRARTWYALWLAVVTVITTSVVGYQRILARLQFCQTMAHLHASISLRRQQALMPLVTQPSVSVRTSVDQKPSPPLPLAESTSNPASLHDPQLKQQQQQQQPEKSRRETEPNGTGINGIDSGFTAGMLDNWQTGTQKLQHALDQLHYRLRRQCEDTSDSSDYALIILKNKVTAMKHDVALELGQPGQEKPYPMGYYPYTSSIAAQADTFGQIRSELRTLKGVVLNPKYLP
ncbi:hypothetical protein H4R34_001038 [Dimargaris verticillata]|uniref:Uncharacterized protein n=1 Tax=Dimargaris verticillata TaxID=2761393 RepID=A0A9W8EEU4_9FUNG|nr:hypothetical protein H4R34_001038 [Dimargaris verticillata]